MSLMHGKAVGIERLKIIRQNKFKREDKVHMVIYIDSGEKNEFR